MLDHFPERRDDRLPVFPAGHIESSPGEGQCRTCAARPDKAERLETAVAAVSSGREDEQCRMHEAIYLGGSDPKMQ